MTGYDHEYPPGEWTRGEIAAVLESEPERYPVPAYAGVDEWEEIRTDPDTAAVVGEILATAEEDLGEPVPSLPATMYLEWVNEGTRNYQTPSRQRLHRLGTFVLAECFERDGRYLDDVLDYAWALCEQAGWAYPTNFSDAEIVEGLPVDRPGEERYVDIRKCETALLLAETDYILGDLLHPALRERIRTEADRRLFRAFEAREDFHWFDPPAHNKNAVCTNRTVSAAMYLLDDEERLAGLIEKGIRSLGHYLAGFDHDGCTAEGVGYWNFGFRHYVWLAAQLEARTGGQLSLVSPPIVEEIARFPMRAQICPDRCPPFSDGSESLRVNASLACWLGERLDVPWLERRGFEAFRDGSSFRGLPGTLRKLLWCRGEAPTVEWVPDERTFFAGHQWWIARVDPADPDGLVVAAKGGHNDEPHNHNDCGSFVVDLNRELLLTDLGSPSYTQYHGGRYEALPARSLGHSVPYVNGCEQAAGREYAASVLDRSESPKRDEIVFELAGSYPDDAGLESLRRSVALDRGRSRVVVEDDLTFVPDAPGAELTSVLVSYFPIEVDGDAFAVRGEGGRAVVRPGGDVDTDEMAVERIPEGVMVRNWGGPEEWNEVWRATVDSTGDADPTLSFAVEVSDR